MVQRPPHVSVVRSPDGFQKARACAEMRPIGPEGAVEACPDVGAVEDVLAFTGLCDGIASLVVLAAETGACVLALKAPLEAGAVVFAAAVGAVALDRM